MPLCWAVSIRAEIVLCCVDAFWVDYYLQSM